MQILSQFAPIKPSVRSPDIKINPFTGKFEGWNTFVQLFDTLIFNESSLTAIERFVYLKSFLRDKPLKMTTSSTINF